MSAVVAQQEAEIAHLKAELEVAKLKAKLAAAEAEAANAKIVAQEATNTGGPSAEDQKQSKSLTETKQKKKKKKAKKTKKKKQQQQQQQHVDTQVKVDDGSKQEELQQLPAHDRQTGSPPVTVAAVGSNAKKPKQNTKEPESEIPKRKACQHWISGRCNRGDKCRFEHVGGGGVKTRTGRSGEQFRKRKRDWEVFSQKRRDVVQVAPLAVSPSLGEATTATVPKANQDQEKDDLGASALPDVPRCTKHDRPCLTRVVVKPHTKNSGRLYHTCSARPSPCAFFRWASKSTADLAAHEAAKLVAAGEQRHAELPPKAKAKLTNPVQNMGQEQQDPHIAATSPAVETQTPRTAQKNVLRALGETDSSDNSSGSSDDSSDDSSSNED
eukprot:INCI6122.1.p1 GENE.INCI6122.1~~INCI6122.1.p1  ORF type:complete len:383 (+),score=104.89 INCI6122.1:261-1409(+)